MAKLNTNMLLFFALVFVFYYISIKMVRIMPPNRKMGPDAPYIIGGIIYTLVVLGLFYLAGLNKTSEGFWDVSDYAQCKGGPYFWQGDSPTAKRCRELASTPEGRCGISSYNCPTGYIGTPRQPFYSTPLSNDQWKNERCEDIPECPCQDVGLCGMVKQVE